MIKESTMLVDDFEDDVLSLLREFNNTTVNSVKRNVLGTDLEALLVRKKYISFAAHYRQYLITRVGTSYLYDVPLYRRGYLSNFRGKRVRVICLQSGNFKFGYRAGVICDSPPEKIIEKPRRRTCDYTFPGYVDSHKVVYKSPRFRVIQANHSIRIFCKFAPKGFVETHGWDSILIDGKIGQPIATLKHKMDGTIEGIRISWGTPSVYPSLREAIDEFKKSPWY